MSGQRPTRGKRGVLDQAPPDIKDWLLAELRGGATQAEIHKKLNERLAEVGMGPVSTATVNRAATKAEVVGERVRETRIAADAMVAKLGERPTAEIGQASLEMLRSIVFDLNLKLRDLDIDNLDDDALDRLVERVKSLSLSQQRQERAAADARKREEAERAALAKKTAEIEKIVRRRGISSDTAADLRRALTTVDE